MLAKLSSAIRRPRGASAVEIVIALILCTLVVMGVVKIFGATIEKKFRDGEERVAGMDRDESADSSGSQITASTDEAKSGHDGTLSSDGVKISRREGARLGEGGGAGELSDEERAEQERLKAAQQKGYAVKQRRSESERRFGSGGGDDRVKKDNDKQAVHLPGEGPELEAGINPFILFLLFMIAGALVSFIFKGQTVGNDS